MSRHRSPVPAAVLVLDAVVVVGVLLAAAALRERLDVFVEPTDVSEPLAKAGPAMALAWLVLLALRGSYQPDVFGAGTDEYKRVVNASALTAGVIGVGSYLAKYQLSRGFFVLSFVVGVPALLLARYAARKVLQWLRLRGHLRRPVLVAGRPGHVDEIAGIFARDRWLGYDVVGALLPFEVLELGETAAGIPVVGRVRDAVAAVDSHDAEALFITSSAVRSASEMRELAWDLEGHDIDLIVTPSLTDVAAERVKMRPVGGVPLVYVERPRSREASRWAKRTFDLVVGSLLLLAASPVLAFAALRIRRHDGGPVLFRQVRIGRGGSPFDLVKLRTMVVDAEEQRPALEASADPGHPLFKLQSDPRITRPGRWLRRYSIDELPQLLNGLRGEMSLVGPRPPLSSEVAEYDGTTHRRLQVRPGMTGLWQVSGRSDLSWPEALRLDLFYVDNWSMIQDLVILIRTIRAVVRGRGAY
jgi:exopolysaccharide biosynthesis polyprenyl glycosylphosphotransferase